MKLIDTAIKEIIILEPEIHTDSRGWFMESFNQQSLQKQLKQRGIKFPVFVQDNHSCSHRGVIRGLHYQTHPHAQAKLIRVVQGRIWDVVVDVRCHSETFGKWFGIELTAENQRQLWIPIGFAHGFIALEEHTQILYKTSDYYYPQYEKTIFCNDPELAIHWPITTDITIKLSDRDSQAPCLQTLQSESLL